jgi:ferredoxin
MPTSPQPTTAGAACPIDLMFVFVFIQGLYDVPDHCPAQRPPIRCEGDETVLSAAIRAGIGLPYGCKNGACGSCKGKVVEGTP